MTAVRIRPAEREDLAGILAIERAVFGDPWSEAAFRSELARVGGLTLVAVQGEALAGYIVAWGLTAEEAEVGNVAVAESARRHGVGAALLDTALAELARRGVQTVFLEVRAGNVAAQALYASRGFAAVGRRPGYYERPREDAVLMRWTGPMQ